MTSRPQRAGALPWVFVLVLVLKHHVDGPLP